MEFPEMREKLIGYRFHRVDGLILRRHTAALRPYGVSFQQAMMLAMVTDGAKRGAVNQRAVEGYTGLTNPAVTKMAGELEKLGLITRRPDPRDGRSRILEPTPLGVERDALFRGLIAQTDEDCFLKLSEEEKALLKHIVEKIDE